MITLKLATIFFIVLSLIAIVAGSSSTNVYCFLILAAIYNAANIVLEGIKK